MPIQIPRRLTVSPDRNSPGTYLVLIGNTKIGWVRKKDKDSRFRGTSFTYIPEPSAFPNKQTPPVLVQSTMKAIKEGLTENIPRDTYMKILESNQDPSA